MSLSTPHNNYQSTYSRFRRHSKPTPPERDDLAKKPNMAFSPSTVQQFSLDSENSPHTAQRLSLDQAIHTHQVSAHVHPQSAIYNSPPPTSFVLHPTDLHNIVTQLKDMMHSEIQTMIQTLFKQEIETTIKNALQSFTREIETLKAENEILRDEVDSLEQYGRRDLVRFSGIVEQKNENTTDIVTKIVEAIDPEYTAGDIIRSHRVGNPNRTDKHGKKLPPRQIIVRVKDPIVKRRILRCTKHLKNHTEYTRVNVNEDLTRKRNTLAYMARKLKNAGHVNQTWTIDGKIFLKNRHDRIAVVTNERSFQRFIEHNCPEITVDFLLSDTSARNKDSRMVDFLDDTTLISYAAAAAAAKAMPSDK